MARHSHHTGHPADPPPHARTRQPTRDWPLMAVLSFVSMYVLMYAMVDALDNVFNNINQVYMAGLMTAPMVIIELVLMGGMYHRKAVNIAIIAAAILALGLFWVLIRRQASVADRQFLRSMIPHHAGALLMCDRAPLSDPETKALCESIKPSQQSEIDQMKRILARLNDLQP